MERLTTRLERLEQRGRGDICPEHEATRTTGPIDWRALIRPFSPDPAERAAYHAEVDALEAAPPCPRCRWQDEPIFRVVCREEWGQYGPA